MQKQSSVKTVIERKRVIEQSSRMIIKNVVRDRKLNAD